MQENFGNWRNLVKYSDIQAHYTARHLGKKKKNFQRNIYQCFGCFFKQLTTAIPRDPVLSDLQEELNAIGDMPVECEDIMRQHAML